MNKNKSPLNKIFVLCGLFVGLWVCVSLVGIILASALDIDYEVRDLMIADAIISLAIFIGIFIFAMVKERKACASEQPTWKMEAITKRMEDQIKRDSYLSEKFTRTLNSIQSLPTSDILYKLNLPNVFMLQDSIFYGYFLPFYQSADGLVMLSIYRDQWGTDKCLVHPYETEMRNRYKEVQYRQTKTEAVLIQYPWLLCLIPQI